MPSTKQGGGYTLTFSRKNQDVRKLLQVEKEKGAILSDFICNCIRFYVNRKNEITNNVDMKYIEDIIDKKIEKKFKSLNKERNLENIEDIDMNDLEEDE